MNSKKPAHLWGITFYYYCPKRKREISCGCADNRDAIRTAQAMGITDFRLAHEIQASY
jgi:hypothetical protein